MIREISYCLVDRLEKESVLKEDKDIYIHGAKLLISTIIGSCLIFLTGIFTGHILQAIIYEFMMSSSREIMGGYHCKSYRSCIFLYWILFILGFIFEKIYVLNLYNIIVVEIIGLFITYIYSPISHINKPISVNKKKKFHRYSLIYIFIYAFFLNIVFVKKIKYVNWLIYIFIVIQIFTLGGRYDYVKNKK